MCVIHFSLSGDLDPDNERCPDDSDSNSKRRKMDHKDVFAAARFAPEKMQKINLFETGNFFCDVYCLEPGQEQKVHAHAREDKFYFVLEGEGAFQVGDEQQTLGKNQIVLAPAGAAHGVRNTSPTRLRLLVVMTPNPNRPVAGA
jgi:mannose-6-phosphate isomerase-like protein (cupin superfamily)